MHSDPRRCLLQSAIPIFLVEDGTRRAPARCHLASHSRVVRLAWDQAQSFLDIQCHRSARLLAAGSDETLKWPVEGLFGVQAKSKSCQVLRFKRTRRRFPRVGDLVLRKVSERRLDPEPDLHHADINPFRTWHAAVRNHLVELSDPRRSVHGRATLATLTYCSPAEPSRIAPAVIDWRPFQELIHGGCYAPP